jgi:thiol-disulfide isomerase/thioredoxin
MASKGTSSIRVATSATRSAAGAAGSVLPAPRFPSHCHLVYATFPRMSKTARRPSHTPTILFGSLLIVAAALVFVTSALAGSKAREPAPRFNATTTSGEKFNNDTVKGKVLLLEFWTTWCGYCEQERPFVERLNEEFGSKGLLILAVNVGESKKTVRKYLEQHPRKARIVLTDDTNLAAMYTATSYPIYVVIDREGNIAGTQKGAGGEPALRELVGRGGLQGVNEDEKR